MSDQPRIDKLIKQLEEAYFPCIECNEFLKEIDLNEGYCGDCDPSEAHCGTCHGTGEPQHGPPDAGVCHDCKGKGY